MKTRNTLDLILLAMLWGGSFLFMRVSVPEFGAVPMMALRVALAALFLLPFLFWKKRQKVMMDKILPISVIGIIGCAIPFSLIAYSTLYVTAGFASVVNAATPMFTATVAFLWLAQRLSRTAVFGLVISLIGVVLLVWDKIGFNESSMFTAILAGIGATVFYGFAANYSKKYLAGVSPLAITTGSLLAAAIFLLPAAIYWWPKQPPSIESWINLSVLAVACTGFAQILFFRLIENTGATNATSVTFLIPAFGLLWGYLFLGEMLQARLLIGASIILLGTGMTTGLIELKKNRVGLTNSDKP
jgi:drug/metabolite transporter (DMT)-like permease